APEVAAQIRRAEEDAESMRCNGWRAAILLTDLRSFTALSQCLSAQELMAVLAEYQSRLLPVIQRHGGSIDKYLGDGILASFGAVTPTTTFAADLCRAIDELATTAEQWRLEGHGLPAPRVGLAGAVGEVVFGTVRHATRLEYTVIGEVANLVAKLEKHTKSEPVRAVTTHPLTLLRSSRAMRPHRPSRCPRPQGRGCDRSRRSGGVCKIRCRASLRGYLWALRSTPQSGWDEGAPTGIIFESRLSQSRAFSSRSHP